MRCCAWCGASGQAPVAEILFTAKIMTAEEARAYGVLQQLYPADSFAAEAAAYVGLNCGERAAHPGRRQAHAAGLGQARNVSATRPLVAAMVAICYASSDYQEGQAAFKEKRTPVFTGH